MAAFYLISLALGVLIVSLRGSSIDLMHVLFGTVLALNNDALWLITLITAVTLVTLAIFWRALVAECMDPLFLRSVSKLGTPVHFIFHSAYCCSTLLARAFDTPGHAMGLKEPLILNDMVGWNLRGGDRGAVANVLDNALTLLARPMAPGEAMVVKPSNIANGFMGAMLGLRPAARAVFLHAPLRTYLASIAKKGIEGRLWVRTLQLNLLKEQRINLGFRQEQYIEHTDLQAAAIGWLVQHAEFQRLATKYGRDRVATLNSETLLANPLAAMRALDRLFGTGMREDRLAAIVAGPAFNRNSKSGESYGSAQRNDERAEAIRVHRHELDWVAGWAERVAGNAGIAMDLPAPLLG